MTYECHGLDTQTEVNFYEQEFYVLSNFSSFRVKYYNIDFDTSEHAYHFMKFRYLTHESLNATLVPIRNEICIARSAHDAFKIASSYKQFYNPNWNNIKVSIMKDILIAKASQHEYVYKKLMETGDRTLIENSWRDDFWGIGPKGDGQNQLGKLWMEIRENFKSHPLSFTIKQL